MAPKRRPRQVVVMMAAVMIAGAACSSATPKDEAPKVATLASAGSTPSASASAASRPRERLDTTPEEFEAMLKPYNECLREHGAKPKQDWGGRRPTGALLNKLESADKICNPQFYPLPPWEKDPANPDAKDFARDVVKCLKGKGIRYVEVGDNGLDIMLGGDQNDRESITKGLDLAPDCERQVAAKGR